MEASLGSALQFSTNILGEDFRLPQRELSGGWTYFPRPRIGDRGTITQRPHPRTALQLERIFH